VKGLTGRLRAILSHLFEFEDCGDALRVTTALVSPHGDYITVFIHEIPEGGYEVDTAPLAYRYPGRLSAACEAIVLEETKVILNHLWE